MNPTLKPIKADNPENKMQNLSHADNAVTPNISIRKKSGAKDKAHTLTGF